jgi:hypothetical protein
MYPLVIRAWVPSRRDQKRARRQLKKTELREQRSQPARSPQQQRGPGIENFRGGDAGQDVVVVAAGPIGDAGGQSKEAAAAEDEDEEDEEEGGKQKDRRLTWVVAGFA